jgi:hypothetical protein
MSLTIQEGEEFWRQDLIIGNGQKLHMFWERVQSHYNNHRLTSNVRNQ